MKTTAVYAGLDYHKDSVQVCVLEASGKVLANRRCANDYRSIVRCVARVGRLERAAIESCCGAADLAEELVSLAGWSIDLAHPGYLQRMKGSPDKTDYSDARMLADLTRVGYLPKVWLAPESIRELRRLVRYRQQLINERRAVKLRIRGLLRESRISAAPANPWTKLWLLWVEHLQALGAQSRWVMDRHLERLIWFDHAINEVERRLHEVTAQDAMVDRLCQQPGIGPVTAWMLRAEIGRFDRFKSGKQVARFCGLSPRNASSGERQADAGLVKAGNNQLRAVIIEAAWRLMRFDARWSALAHQLLARGKPKSVVAAAIGNRWLRWLYHQMRPMGLAS